MRTSIPPHTCVALLALCGAHVARAQDEAVQATPDSSAAAVRTALEHHMADAVGRGFAGVVFVFRDGEVLLHEGYGLADRDASILNDPGTLFDIGSISKQFTRAAIIKLEEQGKLKTSDPIGKHLDAVPEDKATITIDQVLDHEAGLAEYHDTQGDFELMDRAEAFRRIVSADLRFDPGRQRAYSNAGYTLLAIIVEEVSGEGFQSFVREFLLEPAGMSRTAWSGHRDWGENVVATGYGRETFGESNSPARWPEPSWALLGNGGMVSNAAELHAWIQALRAGVVLTDAGVRKLYRTGSSDSEYVVHAGGSDFGFTSAVLEFPARPNHLIVTSNSDARTNAERELAPLVRIAFAVDLWQGRERRVAAGGWGLPDSPTGRGCVAFLNAIRAGTEAAAREFVSRLHPDWLQSRSEAELLGTMLTLQQTLAAPELAQARRHGPGQVEILVRSMRSGRRFRVSVAVDPVAPHRIVGIDVQPEG